MTLLLLAACHSRGLFREMSYPVEVAAVPGQDRYHLLAAELRNHLLSDFDDPALATACADGLLNEDDAVRDAVGAYALCATGRVLDACPPADPVADWPAARAVHDAVLATCPSALTPADRVRITDALLSAASTGARWLQSDLGIPFPKAWARLDSPSCRDDFEPIAVRELYCALETASAGARMLETGAEPHRSSLPALVLSGGSANGAFSAGYVYELLRLRDVALGWSADDPAAKAAILDAAKFSAIVTTSVGSLVALPVDAYFAEEALDPTARRWALDTLRKRFVAEEGDLLCARQWDLGRLLLQEGPPIDSLLEFQPMEAMLRQEMFPPIRAGHLLERGPIRVALSVDARTTLTAVADERACRPFTGEQREDCLVRQVMASITLPVFARGVEGQVAVGLPEPGPATPGDPSRNGLYFDGGVKSGTPAVTALGYARRRVLAISNHRLSGAPRLDLDGIDKLAFRSIDLFTDVVRERELEQAELLVQDRERRRAALGRRFGTTWEPAPFPAVFSVHLPSDTHPEIGAAGYTFDPDIMIALFRWGQRTFLQSADQVLGHLGSGWVALSRAPAFGPEVARRLEWVKKDMARRDNAWTDPGWRAAHQVRRRRAFTDQVSFCADEGATRHAWAIPKVEHDPTYAPEEGE